MDIVLSTICILLLDDKKQRKEKKKEKVNVGLSVARKEKGTGILPSTSGGNFIG